VVLIQEGENQGNAVAALGNLQEYWNQVVCSEEYQQRDTFFYIDDDENAPANGGPRGESLVTMARRRSM
jgi:hypothetical protein